MNLLLRRGRLYEQVFYASEAQFRAVAKSSLTKTLPSFSVLDFSPYVLGDDGRRRRPDLAIVHRKYRMWAVVEVEMEHHSLTHHVIPQINTFCTGRYGDSHAELIHHRDETLDLDHLANLTSYFPPVVMVVVNSRGVLDAGWTILEVDYSAKLTFVESFRSNDEDIITRLSGYRPAPAPRQVIRLRKQEMMNALVCTRPSEVPPQLTEEVRVLSGERPRVWKIVRTRDTVLFLPPAGFMIKESRNYEMRFDDEFAYVLREL